MNMIKTRRPFIPRDKPKSWVISIFTGFVGLVGGLIGMVGAGMKIELVYHIGIVIFVVCWVIAFPTSFFCAIRNISGHYSNIEEKDWEDQIW
jgi:hypothetical protein